MVEYETIIGPHEMAPSDMKYVEKILRSVKIPVRNTGRETYDYSDKDLSVPEKYEDVALKIYMKLKFNFYIDKKMALFMMNKYKNNY